MNDNLRVKWISRHRKARLQPNPAYPNGIDVVTEPGKEGPRCKTDLPYPAPECGLHSVRCAKCGTSVMVTAAGRIDDPKSVTIPCKLN